MNTARMLNDYDLFRGIDAEQMRTLLPCLNARICTAAKGDTVCWQPQWVGLILSGKLQRAGSPAVDAAKTAGQTIRCVESETYLADSNASILKLDLPIALSPCWFSCSFHHRFVENLLAV